MRQAGEPSVDEILESIKKVIAGDARMPATEDRRGQSGPATRASQPETDEDEVLDLAEAAELADGAPLIADDAVTAMRESLNALATMAAPGAAPQIVRAGETSLEGMVRDLLRPALAEWLDKNLPAMVERLVAAEIARIVGKRG